MVTVPKLVSVDPGVVSAAAELGYNTQTAVLISQLWMVGVVGIFIIAEHIRIRLNSKSGDLDVGQHMSTVRDGSHVLGEDHRKRSRSRWNIVEVVVIFAIFAIAYMPGILARNGPYIEDQYFLAALQRMNHGQMPFRDFAFIYGPLMIYPAWLWTEIFGYSMGSFYGFLAFVEGAQFAALMAILQRFVPDRRQRYLIFLLLCPFLYNSLLGLNWNGLRRLMPVLIALMIAYRPYQKKTIVFGCLGLGLHLAYSHDYAIAGLAAIIGMYVISCIRGEGWKAPITAATLFAGTIVVWAIAIGAMMGPGAIDYLKHTTDVMANWSGGHMGFPFYWTANSLALFGLLSIACAIVGRHLFLNRSVEQAVGDRLLICGLGFCFITIKSGLNRADCWHLNAPFLLLILTALLPLKFNVFQVPPRVRRVMIALCVIISLTYLVGIYPTWRMHTDSYLKGLSELSTGSEPSEKQFQMRTYSLEQERTKARRRFVQLGEYLATPELKDREVYFYGHTWKLGPRIGVCRTNFNILVEDMNFERDREYLRTHPDAIVLMTRNEYDLVYGLKSLDEITQRDVRLSDGPTRTAQRWLATVHLDAVNTEVKIEYSEWMRQIGNEIKTRYELAAEFPRFCVLLPKQTSFDGSDD